MEVSLDLSVLSVLSGRMGRGGGADAVIRLTKVDGDSSVHVQAKGVVMFCAATVPSDRAEGCFDVYVRLADLIEISGKGPVTLRILGAEGIEKAEGRTKTRIRACSSEDFPGIPSFGFQTEAVPATEVMDLVATVVKAECYDPDVTSKAGVMVEQDGDVLCAIGADGKRFNIAYQRGLHFKFDKVFVPYLLAEAYVGVRRADRAKWEATDFTVVGDDERGHVGLLFSHPSGATFAVACPRVASSFPSHQRLLSSPVAGEVTFITSEFLDAVTKVADTRWAAGKAVRLAPGDGCVDMSLRTHDVDIETACPTDGPVADMQASEWPLFTASHLLSAVTSFSEMGVEKLRVRFAKNRYPAVFEPADDASSGFRAVLLPRSE